MRRLTLFVATAALVGGALWFLANSSNRGAPAIPGPEPEASAAAVSVTEPPPTPPPEPAPVRSGRLSVDREGRFQPDSNALAWFDSILFAERHRPEAERETRLFEALASSVPESALPAAEDMARRLLAYRKAARESFSKEAVAIGTNLERRLQWIRELRREHFGPELAERLFGEEERAIQARIEAARSENPEGLSDIRLSPEERSRLERTTEPQRLADEVEALRAEGGSDAEVFALRAERVGAEAAARLEALDAERGDFAERLAEYRTARDELIARGARHEEIDSLRTSSFPSEERTRVRLLEKIEAQEAEAADAAAEAPDPR